MRVCVETSAPSLARRSKHEGQSSRPSMSILHREHMKTPQREQLATATLPEWRAQGTPPSGPASRIEATASARGSGGANGVAQKVPEQDGHLCSPVSRIDASSGMLQRG